LWGSSSGWAVLVGFDDIDDSDNSCVDRAVLAALSHASRAALDNEDYFTKAGPYGIDANDMTLFVLAVDSYRPHY